MKPICFISFIITPARGQVYLVEATKDVHSITLNDLTIHEVHKFFFSPIFEKHWCWDWWEIKSNFIIGLNKAIAAAINKKIAAISVIGLCDEIAFLDDKMQLIRNPICSTDEMLRSSKLSEAPNIAIDQLLKRNGGCIDASSMLQILHAIKMQDSLLYGKIKKIVSIVDLISTQLGAEPAIDISFASLSQLLNLKALFWDKELLTKFEIAEHILPELLTKPKRGGSFIPVSEESTSIAGTPLITGMSNLLSNVLSSNYSMFDENSFFVLLESDCYMGCIVKEPILNAKVIRSKIFPMALYDGRWAMLKSAPGLRIIYECCKEWKKNELDVEAILFEMKSLPYKREGNLLDINYIPYWKPLNITAEIFSECVKAGIKIPPSPQKLLSLLLQSISGKVALSLKQLALALHKQIEDDIIVAGEGSCYPAFTERLSDIMHKNLFLLEAHSAIKNNALSFFKGL